MSKAILKEVNMEPSNKEGSAVQFYQAVCAVTEPKLKLDNPEPEYKKNSVHDSSVVQDLKRIQRHKNIAKSLNKCSLSIVPQN